jgi:hypothetical protein
MFLNWSTSDDVLEAIKPNNVQMIDLRFTDLPAPGSIFPSRQAQSMPKQ